MGIKIKSGGVTEQKIEPIAIVPLKEKITIVKTMKKPRKGNLFWLVLCYLNGFISGFLVKEYLWHYVR